MRYTLIAKMDEEITGELGWLPSHASSSYWPTTDAMVLAHDLLEHTSLRDVEDEARAMGAIYFGRYESGYVSSSRGQYARHIQLDDMSSDFYNSLWIPNIQEDGISTLPKQRKLDDWVETDLEHIIHAGKKLIREETNGECGLLEVATFGEHIRNYFRQGYRRANRRYGSRNRLTYLFYDLENRFSKLYKPDYEGQRIICDIPFRSGDIRLRYLD